jgi:hypothetical protein
MLRHVIAFYMMYGVRITISENDGCHALWCRLSSATMWRSTARLWGSLVQVTQEFVRDTRHETIEEIGQPKKRVSLLSTGYPAEPRMRSTFSITGRTEQSRMRSDECFKFSSETIDSQLDNAHVMLKSSSPVRISHRSEVYL